jgi:hypothetical protein
MILFMQRRCLFLITVFLFSVLAMEPKYVQGCGDNGFPVPVENDPVFALCEDAFTIANGALPVAERISRIYAHPLPASSHVVSDNSSRGPPVISFIL